MELRYARFQAFTQLMRPFSVWARRKRMEQMLRLTNITEGMSILDLGGTVHSWSHPFIPSLDITILNLPGAIEKLSESQHRFRYIEGDACKVEGITDQAFDLVFSNSVIEHVGGFERRVAFAREARRIGKAYWIQTPSLWFPIEAHTGMPFWWFYPERLRKSEISRWRAKLPAWTDMIQGTTVIRKSELAMLFPEAKILVERVSGIPKSYTAFKVSIGGT
jgi:SAM-dependent methyltransferase